MALVIVRTFTTRQEAELARGALKAAGIDSMLRSDDAGGVRPALAWSNGVELIVQAEDADAATEVLETEAKRIG